jgi:hypothetical protein
MMLSPMTTTMMAIQQGQNTVEYSPVQPPVA